MQVLQKTAIPVGTTGSKTVAGQARTYIPAIAIIGFFVSALTIWTLLDHHVPVWDSAGHLARSYQCADLLQAHMGFRRKILSLITLSSFYPPLTYYLHGGLLALFGPSTVVDSLPKILWYGLALTGVYLVAERTYHDRATGAVAVAVWAMYPGLYGNSRALALLDIPLCAMVFLSLYFCLAWNESRTWRNAFALGACLGLTFLTKQSGVIFLALPIALLFVTAIIHRDRAAALMLTVASSIGMSLFAVWYFANFSAFKDFVTQNQSVMERLPFIELFKSNLQIYIDRTNTALTGLGTLLFGLGTLQWTKLRATWLVGSSATSALFIHSALDWTPQFRYLEPATIFPAILTASFMTWMWRSKFAILKVIPPLVALWGISVFLLLSFFPYPFPIATKMEQLVGFQALRAPFGTDQLAEPFWPRPDLDWGYAWSVSEIEKREGRNEAYLCLLSDTQQLNQPGLMYYCLLHRSKVHSTTFRTWTMAGYDFNYTEQQLKYIKWFGILQNTQKLPCREFRSPESEQNYKVLLERLYNKRQYELVGVKNLPDGSQLHLVRRKDG